MPVRYSVRELGFDRRADRPGHIHRPEQIIGGYADGILHHHAHLNDVLVAAQKLRSQRIGPSHHAIGEVTADHQPLQLLDLQLRHPVDGPGQRNVNARHDPRGDDFPEPGHHRLLIGRNDVHTAQQPDARDHSEDSAATGGFRRRLRRRQRPGFPLLFQLDQAHRAARSPCIIIFNSSESELRIAVVSLPKIFLTTS